METFIAALLAFGACHNGQDFSRSAHYPLVRDKVKNKDHNIPPRPTAKTLLFSAGRLDRPVLRPGVEGRQRFPDEGI